MDHSKSISAKEVVKKKDGHPKKVVIRRLPPSWNQETCLEQINPLPEYDYFCFVKADPTLGQFGVSRAYISFVELEDVYRFTEKFDGYEFVDAKGAKFVATVEFAMYQKIPKKSKKADPKKGTLEEDADYKSFVASLESQEKNPSQPSIETLLEEIEAKNSKRMESMKQSTPLIDFLYRKREDKKLAVIKIREERRKKDLEKKRLRDEERLERRRRKEEKARELDKKKERERRERLRRREEETNRKQEHKAESVEKKRDQEETPANEHDDAEEEQVRKAFGSTPDKGANVKKESRRDNVKSSRKDNEQQFRDRKDAGSQLKETRKEQWSSQRGSPQRVKNEPRTSDRSKPSSYSASRDRERDRRDRERERREQLRKEVPVTDRMGSGDGSLGDTTEDKAVDGFVKKEKCSEPADKHPGRAEDILTRPPGLILDKPEASQDAAEERRNRPEEETVESSVRPKKTVEASEFDTEYRQELRTENRAGKGETEAKAARDERKKRYKERPERAIYVPRRARERQSDK